MTSTGRRLTVPVEAKKDDHRGLWTAWRTQLQALYTIDPAARGYGIYLVFWFGHESMPAPGGTSVHSAADLALRLSTQLDSTEAEFLTVHVMDLSWPSSAKR